MLLRKGLLTPERIKLMKPWEHSGFNVNASVRIGADDATGRENLARYLIRAPFSMNKIRYDATAQSVIYKTKMVAGPNRTFEIFDPLDFRAVVSCHIPNRGEHLVRYCGYYSSVQRGRRRRQGREKQTAATAPVTRAGIALSLDGGASWTLLATLSGNLGEYAWDAPAVAEANAQCRLAVTLPDDRGGTIARDEGQGLFSIVPRPWEG